MIELPIEICILVLNVFSYINKNILTTKTAKHGYDSIVKAVRTRKESVGPEKEKKGLVSEGLA